MSGLNAHTEPEAAPTGAPRLVLFPGLGADARLFEPQRRAIPYLEVPDWLPPHPREPLRDYAARLAARLAPRAGKALYLGGASFGGAVALEVANHLQPRAVFLVGSLRTPCAIPRMYNWLGRGLARCPQRMVEALVRLAPAGAAFFGPATKEQRRAFLEQLCATPPSFLHWGLRALLDWRPKEGLPAPVFQIHGERDRILPCRRSGADVVVPGAGHLINVTHAGEVNRFILSVIDGGVPAAEGSRECP